MKEPKLGPNKDSTSGVSRESWACQYTVDGISSTRAEKAMDMEQIFGILLASPGVEFQILA